MAINTFNLEHEIKAIRIELNQLKNDVQENQVQYAYALFEQRNLIQQILDKMTDKITDKIIDNVVGKLSNELHSQTENIKQAVDKVNEDSIEIFNSATESNELMIKRLSAIEELLRLSLANKLIDDLNNDITKPSKKELTEEDKQNAFHNIYLSARSGNVDAMYKLAECYEKGWGVLRNPSKAKIWYEAAEESYTYDR